MTVLLVDAKNALYRAIYAGKHARRDQQYHYFVIFLRQIVSWIRRYEPTSVHIFWDSPRKTVWRRKALSTYKDRSDNQYIENISEDLIMTTKVATDFFDVMGVRQYSKKEMEADDLIYAAVTILHPTKSIIVSTDTDMIQMPYNFNSCTVYDPKKKIEADIPDVNPVFQKALAGDLSDRINGYDGIGPKKSMALLLDNVLLEEFLELRGREIYHRNLLLIDLSVNPRLLANKLYVQRRMCKPVNFSRILINDLIQVHKVDGLLQEYADLVLPFQNLQ